MRFLSSYKNWLMDKKVNWGRGDYDKIIDNWKETLLILGS